MNIQNLKDAPALSVVKSDLKVFNIRYLKSLHLITVVGWSITEDTWIKYSQMLADIETHLDSNEEIKLYFKLEIMNTSSVGYLFKIIQRLNAAHAEGKDVKIFWSSSATTYANEMVATGIDMAGMCDFDFQITEA